MQQHWLCAVRSKTPLRSYCTVEGATHGGAGLWSEVHHMGELDCGRRCTPWGAGLCSCKLAGLSMRRLEVQIPKRAETCYKISVPLSQFSYNECTDRTLSV